MTQAVYPVIGRQDRLPFYLTGIGVYPILDKGDFIFI